MPENFDQGQFNFDATGDASGYASWQAELVARKRAVEQRWGIILGKRVRVKIKSIDKEHEGILILVEQKCAKSPPLLRLTSLKKLHISPGDIRALTRIDEP